MARTNSHDLPKNRLVDALEMPDGRLATIESGSAYKNFWNASGFSGHGFLVCIDGEPVAQIAFRFDALRAVRDGRPLLPITQAGLDALPV